MPSLCPRRVVLGTASLLFLAGLLSLTEGIVTLAWQEPITALTAYRHQHALGDELGRTQRALFSSSSVPRLKRIGSQRRQFAALAGRLDRTAHTGSALGRILIPKTRSRFVFVEGSGSQSLEKGPGHYSNTALPGQRGTVGIAGHRTTYLAPFRNIDRLRRGDQIVLSMPYGRFSYAVEGSRVVSPSNTASLRPVEEDRLVLTTCTPLFSAARRLVVTARLKSKVPAGGAAIRDPFPFERATGLSTRPHGVGAEEDNDRKPAWLPGGRLPYHSEAEIMPLVAEDVPTMFGALHPRRH
jgi:sortase A